MAADHLQPPDVDLARVRRGDPFARWFWTGVLIATLAHLAVFVANPGLTIAVPDTPEPPVTVVVDIPDIRIPPPSEPDDTPLPPLLPEGPIVFVPVPDPVLQPEHERALREIASEVGFRPAQRLDRAVAVWIRQSIIFSVR